MAFRIPIQPAIPEGWLSWFSLVTDTVSALRQSGTTASRPQAGLWIGRRYFDTTLQLPIWYSGSGWVNASGASV